MTQEAFSHVDGDGRLSMVDVSGKAPTLRTARAGCRILTRVSTAQLGPGPDSLDVVHKARLSGITAAKRTSDLIPLCHPIGLDDIQVDVLARPDGFEVSSTVTTVGRTGVEMEALAASAFCALSLLASLRTLDPGAKMIDLAVREKTGGKSDWGLATAPSGGL